MTRTRIAQEAAASQASAEAGKPIKRRRGLAAAVGAAPWDRGGSADSAATTTDSGNPGTERGAGTEQPHAAVPNSAGGWLRQRSQDDKSAESALSMAELSERLRAAVGHSLHVAPSAVRHLGAGDGLWLDGAAQAGAVVALYPGVVYTALHHRCDRIVINAARCQLRVGDASAQPRSLVSVKGVARHKSCLCKCRVASQHVHDCWP